MPPTRVYLIRHAETTWNAERRLQGTLDAPLSDRGMRQLRDLTEALQAVQLAAIYSSPLSRARDTAEPIGAAHSLHRAERHGAPGSWQLVPLGCPPPQA